MKDVRVITEKGNSYTISVPKEATYQEIKKICYIKTGETILACVVEPFFNKDNNK